MADSKSKLPFEKLAFLLVEDNAHMRSLIKGILIADDSPRYLAMLTVEHRRDTRGERYEVTVRPLPAAE